MNQSRALGGKGEQFVSEFLEKRGYKIIERNYKARAGAYCIGEVDIIAQKDEILAFVEVKLRKIAYFPISTVVTPAKQRRIVKSAKTFLMKHGLFYKRVSRFDVATVLYCDDGNYEIEYIQNAFGV